MDRLDGVLAMIRNQAEAAERRIDDSQRLAAQTGALRVEGESTNGEVTVTVDGVGQMVDIVFRADLRDLDPGLLSARVLEAHRRAKGRLTNEVTRLSKEIMGPDSAAAATISRSYADTFGRADEA